MKMVRMETILGKEMTYSDMEVIGMFLPALTENRQT